jgi:hypothetical protein
LSDQRLGEPSAVIQAGRGNPSAPAGTLFLRVNQTAKGEFCESLSIEVNASVISHNSNMHPAEVRQFCELDESSHPLRRSAMNQLHLSSSPDHRLLKFARTITYLKEAIHEYTRMIEV